MAQPDVLYHFKPANDGDFLHGLPARDLTAADVAMIWPSDLANALTPGPSGTALYVAADPPKGNDTSAAPAEKGDKA